MWIVCICYWWSVIVVIYDLILLLNPIKLATTTEVIDRELVRADAWLTDLKNA